SSMSVASAASSSHCTPEWSVGGAPSLGSNVMAPAHSPPMAASRAKSFCRETWSCCEIRRRSWPSGKRPAKNGRAAWSSKGSACNGNEQDSAIAVGLASQSEWYRKLSRPSGRDRVPTFAPTSQTSSSCAMVCGFLVRLIRKPVELQFAAQGIDHSQYLFQAHGGLAGFQ